MSWPPKPPLYSPAVQARIDAALGRKPRKPRVHHEANMQIALVAELRQRVIRPARLWFVPNGGNLSRVQRGQFRDMGLTAGVHDLHFIWCDPCPQFATIELKHGKGDTTDGQDEFTRELTLCGHRTAVCWSHDEAIDVLTRWGFPLRRAI